jgi:prepilin-type processing-associated H-X9-DG protein/prepilin-type N-terminal cleavage/methylation domain-containing protein
MTHWTHNTGHDGYGCARRTPRAFTLLEILVSVAIISVLLALVLPIARSTIASARAFKCQMSQRSSAYDFNVFADDVYHGNRGRDAGQSRRFNLETFVASQYYLEEFWAWEGEQSHELPDNDKNDPLRCAEVRGLVRVQRNMPCQSGGVTPWQNVSFGFNYRLRFAERPAPQSGVINVWLRSSIVSESNVPLLWDVDAPRAAAASTAPFFAAPSLGSTGFYANDRYWFPGLRHNKGLNVAFVDGHVESTMAPLSEPSWRWDYSPLR